MINYAPCPQCNAAAAQKVTFTWWGGILGPKLFKHVKCRNCGKGYNGKTGRDNKNAIIIYCVVVGVLAFGLCAALLILTAAVTILTN